MSDIEFATVALAFWHIPPDSLSVPTTLEPLGAEYSPVDQLEANVKNQTLGFSFFLAVNAFLYAFRWAEIAFSGASSIGAKSLARFMMITYISIFSTFAAAVGVAFVSKQSVDILGFQCDLCLVLWYIALGIYSFGAIVWYVHL